MQKTSVHAACTHARTTLGRHKAIAREQQPKLRLGFAASKLTGWLFLTETEIMEIFEASQPNAEESSLRGAERMKEGRNEWLVCFRNFTHKQNIKQHPIAHIVHPWKFQNLISLEHIFRSTGCVFGSMLNLFSLLLHRSTDLFPFFLGQLQDPGCETSLRHLFFDSAFAAYDHES